MMSAAERITNSHLESSRGIRLGRAGWVGAALLSFAILLASIPGYLSSPFLGVLEGNLILKPDTLAFYLARATLLASFLGAACSFSLAVLLFFKKSSDRMGLFLSYYLLEHSILFAGPLEMLYPFWKDAPLVSSVILSPLIFLPSTMALIAIFPDGRFVPPWSRWLIPLSFLSLPVTLLYSHDLLPFEATLPGGDSTILQSGLVAISIIVVIAAVYSQLHRYRFVSTPEQRLQTKWVLYGFMLWVGVGILPSFGWFAALQLPQGTAAPVWLPLGALVWVASTLILPVTLTISITRFRLFEIDRIISRSLVYGALTVSVAAIYALSVGLLGVLFQAQGNLVIALLATGLIAVLFQPLRERLQAAVNRLYYGQRDDPLLALSQLGKRLEAAITPDVVLPTLTETIANTLKLPYVAISLRSGSSFNVAAESGTRVEEVTEIPLVYQGETVGQLIAGARGPGESFNQADKQLLESIAYQAGPAAYTVQLTQDLRHSRVRLVTAREEERRRLRRDLHDGLGPVLASQGLKMAAVGQLLQDDGAKAQKLLEELTAQNAATVAEIRRLVYELRPAALDDLGLVGAVRDYAADFRSDAPDSPRLKVNVRTPVVGLPVLPAAIEVAAYRIATEGLTNIARHAQAQHAEVSFTVNTTNPARKLHLEITDDGIGLPETVRSGVGLISMRERAEEVGGHLHIESSPGQGTHVVAELPLVDGQ
jgi:signal transduction histidine kinase